MKAECLSHQCSFLNGKIPSCVLKEVAGCCSATYISWRCYTSTGISVAIFKACLCNNLQFDHELKFGTNARTVLLTGFAAACDQKYLLVIFLEKYVSNHL
jgi:hypothetical protein